MNEEVIKPNEVTGDAASSTHSLAPLSSRREKVWLTMAIAAWVVAVALAWAMLSSYEFNRQPEESGEAFGGWPEASRLSRAGDRPTLLFFMHPKCACTRASLAELERLWFTQRPKAPERMPQLYIVATVPPGASEDWMTTDTLQRALAFNGAKVILDRDGWEAKTFGVVTSGKVMWFDAVGKRLYSGGITASRGHEGPNAGIGLLARLFEGEHEALTAYRRLVVDYACRATAGRGPREVRQ